MPIDEDTCEWLGLPSPLEMYQQHCLLLENEIQELNLQLRKAREDIFGLIVMLDETRATKDEFSGYLRLPPAARRRSGRNEEADRGPDNLE